MFKIIFCYSCFTLFIVTDNGTSFISNAFKTFVQINGIKHICTAPYHPSSNDMAERSYQTFKSTIKKIIVTGNGTSFISNAFKTFVQINGMKHICTAPYHPSSNDMAEQSDQTFKSIIKKIIEDKECN